MPLSSSGKRLQSPHPLCARVHTHAAHAHAHTHTHTSLNTPGAYGGLVLRQLALDGGHHDAVVAEHDCARDVIAGRACAAPPTPGAALPSSRCAATPLLCFIRWRMLPAPLLHTKPILPGRQFPNAPTCAAYSNRLNRLLSGSPQPPFQHASVQASGPHRPARRRPSPAPPQTPGSAPAARAPARASWGASRWRWPARGGGAGARGGEGGREGLEVLAGRRSSRSSSSRRRRSRKQRRRTLGWG